MLQSCNLTSLRSLTTSSIVSFLMVSTILILGSSSIIRPSLIFWKISIFSSLTSTYSYFLQHVILPLMVEYMALQNNLNMNFLVNNNLVLYTTRFIHNPKRIKFNSKHLFILGHERILSLPCWILLDCTHSDQHIAYSKFIKSKSNFSLIVNILKVK